MNVDPKHHRHFIARKGELLRQISEEFGNIIISFPRIGVKSDKVVLKGARNCIEGAQQRIVEVVNELVGGFLIILVDLFSFLWL